MVVVLTLTHCYNAVRGHKTGQAPIILGRKITSGGKTNKKQKIIHIIAETNRTPRTSDENKKVRLAYVRIKIHMT